MPDPTPVTLWPLSTSAGLPWLLVIVTTALSTAAAARVMADSSVTLTVVWLPPGPLEAAATVGCVGVAVPRTRRYVPPEARRAARKATTTRAPHAGAPLRRGAAGAMGTGDVGAGSSQRLGVVLAGGPTTSWVQVGREALGGVKTLGSGASAAGSGWAAPGRGCPVSCGSVMRY